MLENLSFALDIPFTYEVSSFYAFKDYIEINKSNNESCTYGKLIDTPSEIKTKTYSTINDFFNDNKLHDAIKAINREYLRRRNWERVKKCIQTMPLSKLQLLSMSDADFHEYIDLLKGKIIITKVNFYDDVPSSYDDSSGNAVYIYENNTINSILLIDRNFESNIYGIIWCKKSGTCHRIKVFPESFTTPEIYEVKVKSLLSSIKYKYDSKPDPISWQIPIDEALNNLTKTSRRSPDKK